MTDQDIIAFVSLLLAAGGETTDKAIALIFRNLLARPEQFAAVRADRSLIPAAFAETLRYTPPVQMIMRQPAAEVAVSGGTIPAGATVTCLIGAANRDADHYDRPDAFDIFRPDLGPAGAFTAAAQHVAFGLGRHFCVGPCRPGPRWRPVSINSSTHSPSWASRTGRHRPTPAS